MSEAAGPTLERSIGPVRATALVVGIIIGASIFVQPSVITGQVPTPAAIFGVWAISGVLTLFGALVCAELASAFPETGGVYVFLRRAYGPAVGFLWGWAMFWTMHSGIVAAIAVIFARYVGYFAPLGDVGVRLVAIGAIGLLSAVNYIGVRQGSTLHAAFTIGKVVAIVAIIVLGLALAPGVEEVAGRAGDAGAAAGAAGAGGGAGGATAAEVEARDFILALIAGLFAFGGWHMVTYTAEETIEPERTIPMALWVGTLLVTVCYIALNLVYLQVLPLETVIRSTRVAADAADAVLGSGGGAVMAGLVVFSTFGAVSGVILAGPRVYYAMARDGLLFRWFAAPHPRFRTPHRAIVAQAVWSSILVATGTYRALFTRVVYTEWIFFGLMAAGLMLLRRRSGYAPRYRVWGYPVVPIAFIVATAVIVGNQIIADPVESAFGLALVLVGLPVYWIWLRERATEQQPPEKGAKRADH